MASFYSYDPYLSHYGIKRKSGRYPWGSGKRPHQHESVKTGIIKKDGYEILEKGTKLGSVAGGYWGPEGYSRDLPTNIDSNKYKDRPAWNYFYDAEDKWDSKVYKGPFVKYLVTGRGMNIIREHEYEVLSDIKMPSRETRIKEFENLLNDKKYKKDGIDVLKQYQKMLVKYGIGNKEEQRQYKNFNPKKIKTKEDLEVAYSIFNHAMESKDRWKFTKAYGDKMSEKYDAMVDDNNKGVYNNAKNPVIIFKAEKLIKDISDPKNKKFISPAECQKYYEEVKSHLAKTDQVVKL